MSLLCMPWLLTTMGGEMLYILDQRLRAQAVPLPKAKRVLCEVTAALLDPGFLAAGALPPQPPWPVAAMRSVLERAAHASIMRISDASMAKLFDLALAGAKCQLAAAASLDDVAAVALRHLEGAQALLAGVGAAGSAAGDLAARAEAAVRQLYLGLPSSELVQLRHALMRWFQDRHVRVSMLLSEGLQAEDGRPLLPPCGHGLGPNGRPRIVGRVTAYARDQTRPPPAPPVACDEHVHKLAALAGAGPSGFLSHPLPAGDNLYAYAYGKQAGGRLGSSGGIIGGNDDDCGGVRATFRRTESVLNSDSAAKAAAAAAVTTAAPDSSIDFLARLLGRRPGGGGGSSSGNSGGGHVGPPGGMHLVLPALGGGSPAAVQAAAATATAAGRPPARALQNLAEEKGGEGRRGEGPANTHRAPGAARALEFGAAGAASAHLAAVIGDLAFDDDGGGGGGGGGDGLLDLLDAAAT